MFHHSCRMLRVTPQYSINKSKVLLGFVGHEWEQRAVSELDSALNQWVDSVPDHRKSVPNYLRSRSSVSTVRWDPNREDVVFFEQSAHLYAAYYMLQITVHRPFIPTQRDAESTISRAQAGFPSLVICTNAARACANVVQSLLSRVEYVNPDHLVRVYWQYLRQRELCADTCSHTTSHLRLFRVSCCFSVSGVAAVPVQWSTPHGRWRTSTSA
jgi:hypothetical protein